MKYGPRHPLALEIVRRLDEQRLLKRRSDVPSAIALASEVIVTHQGESDLVKSLRREIDRLTLEAGRAYGNGFDAGADAAQGTGLRP